MEEKNYDDIIDLPRHISPTRTPMSLHDRAAQFAPFAALTGHSDAVRETARLTEDAAELDESRQADLNRKLLQLAQLPQQPEVSFTWFVPDERKAGGAYRQATGFLKKLDPYAHTVILTDQTVIPIDRIYAIESDIFRDEQLF